MPDDVQFQTKPQIGVDMHDRPGSRQRRVRRGMDVRRTARSQLLVARDVRTGEVKYFLSNRVPGEMNPHSGRRASVRWLLRTAFGRCSIESCFREAKDELGLDQQRNETARIAHRKTRIAELASQGIDVTRINSCITPRPRT